MAPIGGIALSAPAGSELRQPLQIEVRDPTGLPAKGVAVVFRIVTGKGAVLTDTLVATDADGIGLTRLRLGTTRDSVVVAGSVRGQEDRGVTFRVLASAPAELFSVEPTTFASGDTLTLRGARLADPAGDDVFFGTARGRLVGAATDTMVRVVVPPCLPSGAVPISVRTGSAATNSVGGIAAGGNAPLSLAPGEAVVVRGTDAGCLRLTTPGQRFILVPQFATYVDSIPAQRPFSLSVDAASPVFAAADSARTSRPAFDAGAPPLTPRAALERALRGAEDDVARDIVEAASEPTVPNDAPTPSAPPHMPAVRAVVPAPPALGTTRSFRVLSRLDGTAFTGTTAKLRYAGDHILVYEDVNAPAPLTDPAMAALGDLFDRTLYPIDARAFGAESDIDGNGRVIVLMSPLVNALTPATQCAGNGYVPGYFFGVDLDTRNKNSNQAEIFFAYVPDPKGERSCPHRLEDVLGLLPSTFLHEFQHMISFNQHVLVRRGGTETTWLNEGLSHMAEELGARYYDDRAATVQLPDSALPFLRGNLENAVLYLSSPPVNSVTAYADFGTLAERGATWLFLRWLGAQKGDGVYARLVQTGLRGGQNVEAASGESFPALFGDFGVALYADSLPGLPRSAVPPRLRMGRRSLRDIYARVIGLSVYPLAVRGAPFVGSAVTATMLQGTGTYFDLFVPTGGVTVRLTGANGAPLSPALVPQLAVYRIAP